MDILLRNVEIWRLRPVRGNAQNGDTHRSEHHGLYLLRWYMRSIGVSAVNHSSRDSFDMEMAVVVSVGVSTEPSNL